MPLTTGGAINDEDPVSDRHRQPVGCPWSSRSDVAGISGRMPWNTHLCAIETCSAAQEQAPVLQVEVSGRRQAVFRTRPGGSGHVALSLAPAGATDRPRP